MNAACTPNGAAVRFVPGSRIILQSSVLSPTFARRARQCLPRDFSRPRRTRRRLLVSASLQFDFIVLRASRLEPTMAAPSFSAASVRQKTPAEGSNRAAGCCGSEAEGGSPSTGPTCGMLSSKGGGCRFDSRLWNPEIALTTLMSGHAVSHVEEAGGSHLNSTLFAAAPATSNQHA